MSWWNDIPNNKMVTYDDVNRGLKEGDLASTGIPLSPPNGNWNLLISAGDFRASVDPKDMKVQVFPQNQMVARGDCNPFTGTTYYFVVRNITQRYGNLTGRVKADHGHYMLYQKPNPNKNGTSSYSLLDAVYGINGGHVVRSWLTDVTVNISGGNTYYYISNGNNGRTDGLFHRSTQFYKNIVNPYI